MRVLLFVFIFINIVFANSENIVLVNQIKSLIQKEEYISLAINKYISQNKTIPKKIDNTLDWDKLKVDDYLGLNFDKKNPFTNNDLIVTFDINNNCFIKGILEIDSKYNTSFNYLYNFYINKMFRVNTLAPQNNSKIKLLIGSQVIYGKLQEDIIKNLKAGNKILFDSESCTYDSSDATKNYFYELKNQELTYKYCKGTYSFAVYQESPIYLENSSDLPFVKAKIGDIAYVQKNGEWFEYYYQGKVSIPWIPVSTGEKFTTQTDTQTYQEKISNYIPNAKDLLIRRSGGCMLSNGDIYCWGNNDYNKAGISSFGQLDTSLTPDFINTPVMLKTQIDSLKINTTTYDLNSKKWYNNPYRVKFDKMSMNSTNVCGITKIFEYVDGVTTYKFGGDLYCNGSINSTYYEDLDSNLKESSILKRNKSIYTNKSTQIKNTTAKYLIDIAMVEDAIALLDDTGKIYTIGKNYSGSLGVAKNDLFYFSNDPILISSDQGVVFKKIFALRDTRTFGAIDSNNLFYIWGERGNSFINKPTLLSSIKFNPDAIFVNNNEFILRDLSKKYYKTNSLLDLQSISIGNSGDDPISISYYKDKNNQEYLLYIDSNLKLKELLSSSLLKCKETDESTDCDTASKGVFDTSLTYLNSTNNTASDSFANFTNVSIFKLDHQVSEVKEDFENNWNQELYQNGGTQATRFLGRWAKGSSAVDFVNKTYDFGVENANKNVTISLNFYEIDSWDNEYFKVYLNGVEKFSKQYAYYRSDGGVPLVVENYVSDYIKQGEKHEITVTGTLDSNGKIRIGFSSTLDEALSNESWGVDNIKIVRDSDSKVLSFEDFEDTIYQDWNRLSIQDGGTQASKFLGRWAYGSSAVDFVNKTYDFGVANANKNVTISLDFYEIDSWDTEYFKVYLNGVEKFSKQYAYYRSDGGVPLVVQNYASDYYMGEKHKITVTGTLDSNGKIRIGFSSTLDEGLRNESWGVDNIQIVRDSDSKVLSFEDFENVWNNEWNRLSIQDGGSQATNFLGRWAYGSSAVDFVNKTYDFGVANANKNVTISLDFYEIDTWDTEYFKVYLNGVEKFAKQYAYYRNDGGVPLVVQNYVSDYYMGEKNKITVTGTLDSNGKIRIGFSSTLDEELRNESWGVDNIQIVRDSDSKVLSFEDFEKNATHLSWSNSTITKIIDNGDTTQVPATTFLGKFPIVNCVTGVETCNGDPFIVTKKYTFGSQYANYDIEIEFDFYEIDTWDGERFEFYANDQLLAIDHFVMDGHESLKDSNITGVNLQDNISPTTSYISDQTYRYKLRTKLDSNGNVVLKFQTNWESTDPTYTNYWSHIWYDVSSNTYEDVNNESWGIDNIRIRVMETNKKFVCAMTGVESASQMYCWGNVARSMPILSTSLYDVSKISAINKLFISQDAEKFNQMSYDEFFNNGKLFLKYPTYISGFDYPFYFR